MNATETTQENETRVNVEIDISKSAAFTLIDVLTDNLAKNIVTMDDDVFSEIVAVVRMLRVGTKKTEEVY